MTPTSRRTRYVALIPQRSTAMTTEKQPGKQEGIKESQQDRKQDDVAKSRPAQSDQQIHDANTRRPPANPTR